MYLKEDQKNTGKGNSLIFTKHVGIISSLVFELEVVVGCESIKDNYYVCLFWLDSFLCTYMAFLKQKKQTSCPSGLMQHTSSFFSHSGEMCLPPPHVP